MKVGFAGLKNRSGYGYPVPFLLAGGVEQVLPLNNV